MAEHTRKLRETGRSFLREVSGEIAIARDTARAFASWQANAEDHQRINDGLGYDERLQKLEELMTAIAGSADLWDINPIRGPKPWLREAKRIASEAASLLKQSGRTRVSKDDKNAPVIAFVCKAMIEVYGLSLPEATVASALRRERSARAARSITLK